METFSNYGGAILGFFLEEFTPIETEQLKRLDLSPGTLAYGESGKWLTKWARQRSFSGGLWAYACRGTEKRRQRQGEHAKQRDCSVFLHPFGLIDRFLRGFK
jgi:hypothetical protein|uniref:Uncharacterized protein n=1 Tax=Zea mays TaxID=4577 RepID=C4J200_MAIZE|nr:unknown [Zea mays]